MPELSNDYRVVVFGAGGEDEVTGQSQVAQLTTRGGENTFSKFLVQS